MFILKTVCKRLFLKRGGFDLRFAALERRGFTLLEVMISVSIIALVFVSLFRMQAGTIDLAATGKFNVTAPVLASQLLVDIERELPDPFQAQGEFGENYPGFSWTCEVSDPFITDAELLTEDNQNALKKIQIEITGPDGKQSYKIQTWRVVDSPENK